MERQLWGEEYARLAVEPTGSQWSEVNDHSSVWFSLATFCSVMTRTPGTCSKDKAGFEYSEFSQKTASNLWLQ